jgi:transcriptional regulator CtsR
MPSVYVLVIESKYIRRKGRGTMKTKRIVFLLIFSLLLNIVGPGLPGRVAANETDIPASPEEAVPAVPAAPANLRASAVTATQINLFWNDLADNETGYEIERKAGSGDYVFLSAVGENATAFTDTGFSAGAAYSYRVRAYKAGTGDIAYSAYSNEASPPAAPSNLSAKAVSDSQVNLSWRNNASNATGFVIERKKGSEGFVPMNTVGNVTTFADTDLSAGMTYTYRVKAIHSQGDFTSGESLYSNEVSVSVGRLPAAPSNLKVTPVSSTGVELTWKDNADNETGFKIERKKAGGSYIEIATVGNNVTSYTNTKLSTNTTYYYRVRAYNVVGDSGYSNEARVTASPPAAPTKLKVTTVSSSRLRLSWTDNAGDETGFLIERKKKGGSYSQIDRVAADTEEYTDTGLSANTTYYYRVRAYNTVGNSGYSNEASAVTTLLAAPSRLTATTVSTSRIKLDWEDNANNETGFKIERKKAGGSYTQIATVKANVETYENTGLANNTTYYYRVRAYNSATNSDYSNEDGATTGMLPAAPTNLSATALSGTEIKLTWRDRADNETGFRIERKRAGGSYSRIATVGRNTTSYTDTDLTAGTNYSYRIKAYNSTGESAYSNVAEATTGVPAAPTNLRTVDITSQRVRLTWSDNSSNESGFKIERKKAGGSYSQIATVGANTVSYTDTGLATANTYYYRVRAYNSTGNSAYTGEIKAVTTEERVTMLLYIGKTGYSVDGRGKIMDAAPMIKDNRTLLPIRYVAEAIGAQSEWVPSTRKVTVTLKGNIIELWINNPTARVNGESRLIDPRNKKVTPLIVPPGRTMLPLRFIAENLGCQVD